MRLKKVDFAHEGRKADPNRVALFLRHVMRRGRHGVAAFAIALLPFGAGMAAADAPINPIMAPQAGLSQDAEAETLPSRSGLKDPFEPANRVIFGFNDVVDTIVLRPVASVYRILVPELLRTGISNAVANVYAPVTLANDILQGDLDRAETTLVRILVNSTVGFGGFVDVARHANYPAHTEDFGQTLAVHNVGPGPYLVLPLIGPSTTRHAVGRVADTFMVPHNWLLMDAGLLEQLAPTMADTVVTREATLDQLDIIRDTSTDYYASVRDLYWQHRQFEIANGMLGIDTLPDIDDLPDIPAIDDELADIPDID